jgi:C4-dicarboxylate transporter, DctQ subunit
MKTLARWIGTVVAFVAGVLLLATCVIVFTEVMLRYFNLGSLAWADEGARFLFIWTALLGAVLGVKDGAHFTITMLVARFPGSLRALVLLAGAVGASLVFGVMVRDGWGLVLLNLEQISPSLGISMSAPYLVVPVGGALMLFFTWVNVIDELRDPKASVPAGLNPQDRVD